MTNLVPVNDPRPGQTLQCCHCYKMYPADEVKANLDGPAFQSYWCRRCEQWAKP